MSAAKNIAGTFQVFDTAAHAELAPGPLHLATADRQIIFVADLGKHFKWKAADATAIDHTSVLGHIGGGAGRWLAINTLASAVGATAPISLAGGNISIPPASGATAGSMSITQNNSLADLVGTAGVNVRVDCAELLLPATSDPAGLLTATATSVAIQTKLAAGLIAGGKTALLTYPRVITFTTAGSTPSDAPPTAAVVGTGPDGLAQSETVTIPQTNTIVVSAKAYKTITSITYAAGDGAGATVSIGIGDAFAPASLPKLRAGGIGRIAELYDGAPVATAATIVLPASSAPWGLWTPNGGPNVAHNYALHYERA